MAGGKQNKDEAKGFANWLAGLQDAVRPASFLRDDQKHQERDPSLGCEGEQSARLGLGRMGRGGGDNRNAWACREEKHGNVQLF